MGRPIVLTGGGSGGHITPLMAVAAELKRREPALRLIYIGQTGDSLGDIPANDPHIDEVYTVRAGKFRRYHGEGLRQLLDIQTFFLNVRDAAYVVIGLWQSWRLMKRLQPAVVFSRGGFVSVPVCLGAALRHIPFITHDSDSIPSLANRIIARWAAVHAVALPKDLYPYPANKTVTTGVPISHNFSEVSAKQKAAFRQEIAVPAHAKLLFIIGGGLGSIGVNAAVAEALPHLIKHLKDLHVMHVVGRQNETAMKQRYEAELTEAEQGRVRVFGYMDDVYRYSGAADLIVTRGGATNLAEFATQGRACIVIPSSFLAGGHQLENARYLAEQHAAVVLKEEDLRADPNRLAKQVAALLSNPAELGQLGTRLATFAKPHATEDLAKLVLETAEI
jgi:UDP-N-acetylglucosamine--N-acetylmuramyl-(pentapeptide) pyrophosphoryl-undecaprenol N-acetylglucosamine transferase